jgi:hypothetical protein
MFFLLEVRECVHEQNPHLRLPEVDKLIGKMWFKMSDEEKQPYIEKGDLERERYKREMELYVSMTNSNALENSDVS